MLSSTKVYPAWSHIGREPRAGHFFQIGLVAAGIGAIASCMVISSLTGMVMTMSQPISAQAIVFRTEPSAAANVGDRPAATATAPSPTLTSAAPTGEISPTNTEATPEGNTQSGRKSRTEKHSWAWEHNPYWRSSSRGSGPSHGSISSER